MSAKILLSNYMRLRNCVRINTAGRIFYPVKILVKNSQNIRTFATTQGVKMAESTGLSNEEAAALCKPADAATKV